MWKLVSFTFCYLDPGRFFKFSSNFGDFGITEKLTFFIYSMSNFTAVKRSVWIILIKTCLTMITIIMGSLLTKKDVKLQNPLLFTDSLNKSVRFVVVERS